MIHRLLNKKKRNVRSSTIDEEEDALDDGHPRDSNTMTEDDNAAVELSGVDDEEGGGEEEYDPSNSDDGDDSSVSGSDSDRGNDDSSSEDKSGGGDEQHITEDINEDIEDMQGDSSLTPDQILRKQMLQEILGSDGQLSTINNGDNASSKMEESMGNSMVVEEGGEACDGVSPMSALILPLFALLSPKQQARVFSTPPDGKNISGLIYAVPAKFYFLHD